MRRIYGDFSSPRLKSWTDVLQKHAIDPYQQFAYTTGKNASDIALVIDAMDLLHSGRFDGFCLVSSDSDFTRLASRLREEGADVYGFGAQKTPESFRQACRRFIYTENLVPEAAHQPERMARRKRAAAAQRRGALAEQGHRADGDRGRLGRAGRGRPAAGHHRLGLRSAHLRLLASSPTSCATPAPSRSTSPAAASCVFVPSRRGRPPLRRAAAEPDRPPKRPCEAACQNPFPRHDAARISARTRCSDHKVTPASGSAERTAPAHPH